MKTLREVLEGIQKELQQIEYDLPMGEERVRLHGAIISLELALVRLREELGE